jgi:hypothetical protein
MDAILLFLVIFLLGGGFLWVAMTPRKVATLQNPREPVTVAPDSLGFTLIMGIGAVVLVLGVLFGLAFALAGVTP